MDDHFVDSLVKDDVIVEDAEPRSVIGAISMHPTLGNLICIIARDMEKPRSTLLERIYRVLIYLINTSDIALSPYFVVTLYICRLQSFV